MLNKKLKELKVKTNEDPDTFWQRLLNISSLMEKVGEGLPDRRLIDTVIDKLIPKYNIIRFNFTRLYPLLDHRANLNFHEPNMDPSISEINAQEGSHRSSIQDISILQIIALRRLWMTWAHPRNMLGSRRKTTQRKTAKSCSEEIQGEEEVVCVITTKIINV